MTRPDDESTQVTPSVEAQAKYRPQGEYVQQREDPSGFWKPGKGAYAGAASTMPISLSVL